MSKEACFIMGILTMDVYNENILESTGGEDQTFLVLLHLIQDSFLTQYVVEPNRGEGVRYCFAFAK